MVSPGPNYPGVPDPDGYDLAVLGVAAEIAAELDPLPYHDELCAWGFVCMWRERLQERGIPVPPQLDMNF